MYLVAGWVTLGVTSRVPATTIHTHTHTYIHTYSEGVTYIPRAPRLTGLWFEIRPKLGCEWSRDRQAPTHPSGQLPTYSICRHTYGVRPGTRLGTMPLP